ncbi:MAG: DNA polymerase III subunit chi [Gallionellales bacterium RIFCSPLOWO2_02_FULL_57_47]|nr:MAG: DNA polymerase III subunit chi [Gallionellales bacterium RIFCSPLOWO2_02_FULL_57_47]OGT13773.1 MAG: DNA polymerase III subunit chi [Gallionellales bacterium RIFCSPHIGHO2_02_FULL_57_16]
MTKVDFYTGSNDKLRTACQLSHKAMQNGVRTIISTHDDATADALDKLLWHFPATAFIPHCRSDAEEAAQMPVVLNYGSDKFPHHDLLISLHNECMPFFSRFERVIEIVSHDAEDSRIGRERYKYYKDRGYELRHIDLTGMQNS